MPKKPICFTYASLCETLKFYNSVGIIGGNTDPSSMDGHPFKWWNTTTDNTCMTNGFQPTCFTDFTTALQNWKTAEQ